MDADLVERYVALALEPDVEALTRLLDDVIATSGHLSAYDELIRPALVEVGRRWEADELTVADEHLITALTEQMVASRRIRSRHGPTAVVACTPANEHRVGAGLVADAIRLAGWQPLELGARTPWEQLADLCRRRDARLVALSVGMSEELDGLDQHLAALRSALGESCAILVGGGALLRAPGWHPPPGVTVADSTAAAQAVARRLLTVSAQ